MIDMELNRSLQETGTAVASATLHRALRQRSAHIEARARDQQRAADARPRVLHVDADADSALMLAALLVPETAVTHVGTLAAALQAVGQQQYGLVVLDPELPDGDGAALIAALKRAGANTPVLLYSTQQTIWSAQASASLLKPWASPRQLWGAATRLLGLRPPALPAVLP